MGLCLLACILAIFCLCLGVRTLALSVHAPSMYMQRQRKQASRQAKKQLDGKHAKGQAIKKSQTRAKKHVIKQKKVS